MILFNLSQTAGGFVVVCGNNDVYVVMLLETESDKTVLPSRLVLHSTTEFVDFHSQLDPIY